jgi:hypothetical protein
MMIILTFELYIISSALHIISRVINRKKNLSAPIFFLAEKVSAAER